MAYQRHVPPAGASRGAPLLLGVHVIIDQISVSVAGMSMDVAYRLAGDDAP